MTDKTKINSGTLMLQLISVLIILAGYYTSKLIILIGGILCTVFLLCRVEWTQRYSLLYFLFPFTSVFTLGSGITSVFILLRVAVIIAAIMYNFKSIKPAIISSTLFFVIYCLYHKKAE